MKNNATFATRALASFSPSSPFILHRPAGFVIYAGSIAIKPFNNLTIKPFLKKFF